MKPENVSATIVFLLGFAMLTAIAEFLAHIISTATWRAELVRHATAKNVWRVTIGIYVFAIGSLPLSMVFAELSRTAGPIGMGLVLISGMPALCLTGCVWLVIRGISWLVIRAIRKSD